LPAKGGSGLFGACRGQVVKVSIKDIARAAGVSHSTVSRALSDSPLIKEETKARIRRLAREMGYSPDAGARGLVVGRTQTIGVVVTTIADPFVAEVVQGIESTAYEHAYTLILATSNDEPDREIAAVETLRSKRVDAVIVTSSRVGALYSDLLERTGVPVVLLNNHAERGTYSYSVRVDDVHGARTATEHLLALGHRRIAHVMGPAGHTPSDDRLHGYLQALREAGIDPDPALVVPGNGRPNGGERALHQLWSLAQRPSAVFCYNDMTAIGLLRAAREMGVAVPGDLAVVGFDDIPFASYTSPSLTTIAQPKFELGQRAARMALALISRHGTDGEEVTNVVLPGQLVIRESSGVSR